MGFIFLSKIQANFLIKLYIQNLCFKFLVLVNYYTNLKEYFMKAKVASFITILCVILVAIVVSLIIVLSGMKNGGFNYVLLELTPKIEFVTNRKHKVVSVKPLNEEARIVIAGEDFLDKGVEDAITTVLTNSLKADYLKIYDNNKGYNIIKLTVVPGLTQALDVHVFRAINKFLVNNEVMAVIVENGNDMEMIKEAKKMGISANKLALINSCVNSNTSLTKKSLKHKMEDELIDLIMSFQESYKKNYPITDKDIEQKTELIKQNQDNYEKHISSINKKDAGKFVKKLQELTKKEQTKLELNYSKYA